MKKLKRHNPKIFVCLLIGILAVVAMACQKKDTNQVSTPKEIEEVKDTSQNEKEVDVEVVDVITIGDNSNEPAANEIIHIGYNGGLCQAAIAIAHEKGFFAEQGLKTELTKSENARDAIAGRKIDTSAGMIAGWLKPITNGVDIVFTVGLHTGCTSVVTLVDSGINSIADAKGGVFAFSGGVGGSSHNIAYRLLQHDGLQTTDFSWKDFQEDQLLLILQKKEAPIAIVGDQLAEKWVQEGLVRRIRSTTLDEDFKHEACCVLGIGGEFLRENPITSEKISKAVYEAALWVQDNPEEAAEIMLAKGHISGDKDYAVDLLNLYDFAIPTDTVIDSVYTSVDEYKALGIIDADIDADQLKEDILILYESIYN